MLDKNSIFIGDVYHARHTPFVHDFKYRVMSVLVDVDDLDRSADSPKYFSFNRFNLLSLHLKNHGPRDGSPIRTWIEKAAKDKGIDVYKIYMITFPRILGYVFSPLTVYFCYDKANQLTALLYQVKNTFGEQHGYLLATENNGKIVKQGTDKIFHVSPFIQMDCHYEFRIKEPSKDGFHIAIHQTTENDKILTATWSGEQAMPLSKEAVLKTFWRIPFMGLKVITAIHWQALKIWIKGASFYKSPDLPDKEIS